MNTQEILKQHKSKQTNANSLGIASEIFADYELTPTVKNLNKRVSLLFTDEDGDSIRVNASRAVNDLYRNGQLSLRQMLGLPVYMNTTNAKGEPLTDADGNPITTFSIGTTSGASTDKVKDIKVDVYKAEAIDLDSLS